MEMTNDEIVMMYREAKNKKQQIRILAELNCCSKDEILRILKEGNVKSTELPRQRAKKDEKESQMEIEAKQSEKKEEKKQHLPECVKEAIAKQMVEEQEAIDRYQTAIRGHEERLQELNEFLTGRKMA